MKNTFSPKDNTAYTILEALIAISVIVTGIFSVLTLTVSSLSVTSSALDYLVAANLAREGIELVRNQRDTNWYKEKDFDYMLTNATYYTAVVDYNDVADDGIGGKDIMFTFIDDDIDDLACQLHRSNGVYTRDIGSPTSYYRLIYLNHICQDISASPVVPTNESVKSNGEDCDGETKIGIDIVSKVKWLDNKIERTVELNSRVYDWR